MRSESQPDRSREVRHTSADGLDTDTQRTLRSADIHLREHVPPELKVSGSGGKGVATLTPWVGFFDPDETSSPRYGVYVVYLFSEDLEHVTLTLNQGIERLREAYGSKTARELLSAEAAAVRALLGPRALEGLGTSMHLGSTGDRQRAYEAGNIASLAYRSATLPPETTLRSDLSRLLGLYREAVVARQFSLATSSNRGVTGGGSTTDGLLDDFRPKDASEYLAHLTGRTMTKSRTHEALVRDFGVDAAGAGWKVASPHPRDATLRKGQVEWLVEAKVVYRGNATEAVRAAIGQLFTYRHFHYGKSPVPRLLALFDGPIGDAYVELLQTLGIESMWRSEDNWVGSDDAPEISGS